jgi:hypothetical protein
MKRRSTRQDRGEDRSASGLLSTILAQALERAMPEVAFRSDVAVFHDRHIFRLDPRSFSVLTGFVSGDFAVVIASSFRRISIELLRVNPVPTLPI